MKDDEFPSNKEQIANEILAYLSDHPDAEDTLEGIVEWWLLERKIRHQKALVKEALNDLISLKLIHERPMRDSIKIYQLNRK